MEPKRLTPEELEQIRAREVKRRVLERAAGVIGFPRALKPYGAELDRLMLLGHIAALEEEVAAEREQSESWRRKRLAWKIDAVRQRGRAEKAEADLAVEREARERAEGALKRAQEACRDVCEQNAQEGERLQAGEMPRPAEQMQATAERVQAWPEWKKGEVSVRRIAAAALAAEGGGKA